MLIEDLYLKSIVQGKDVTKNSSDMSQEIYTYSNIIVLISDRICFERVQDGPFSHYSVFYQPFTDIY